jgi:DNA polymerase III epsilon subunit-like protein
MNFTFEYKMPAHYNETYISVDVETAGPNPAEYSLLSIGACTVFEPLETFYVELQPVHEAFSPEALQISGLSMEELREHGTPPQQAMGEFAGWLKRITTEDSKPIFVAFNAPFDWMFVEDYFHRYLGHNPFGHSAIDMKAYYMGWRRVPWRETGMDAVSEYLTGKRTLSHHALQDARDQAELFRKMLGRVQS